jgi:glycosyltransferase involved in cell wall biosynthesis
VRFSVIIPTCNRPDFVLEAVASVLRQGYDDFELIVINDGATPVALPPDDRIRLLSSQQRGAVPARNLGIATAQGDAVAWLDDDDIWTDVDFLGLAAARLSASADFVFADGALVYPNGGPRQNFAQDADVTSLAKDNTILISAVCYRKSLHQKLGLFDETLPYYWDWDWYLRVARAGCKLLRINSPVVDIRIHPKNMSGIAHASPREKNLGLFCQKHGLENIVLKSHVDFAR